MTAPGRVVLAAALACALAGAGAAVGPPPTPAPVVGPPVVLDRIAAVVGDDVVLESEISRLVAVEVTPRKPGETGGAYRDRVLDERIVEVLRDRELRQTGGFDPTSLEVDARLAELAARVEREQGETFDAVLARAGVTRAEASGWIRRGLATEAYARERILPTIRVSDEEVKAYFEGPFREEARSKGLAELPPLPEVSDQLRELLRERRLTEEIARWTDGLRAKTRILIYRRPPVSVPGPSARR